MYLLFVVTFRGFAVCCTDPVFCISGQIEALSEDVRELLDEEQEEKAVRIANMEASKAANMIEFEDQIAARPAKSWFQTPKEKLAVVTAAKEERDKLAQRQLEGARRDGDRAAGKPVLEGTRKSLTELLEEKMLDKTVKIKHGDHRSSRKKKRREQMMANFQKQERREIQQERDEAAEAKKAAKAKGKRPEKAVDAQTGAAGVKRARSLKTIMEHEMGKQKRQKRDKFSKVVRCVQQPRFVVGGERMCVVS